MKYPPPPRGRRLHPASFKLTPELESLLDRLAEEMQLSRSAVVREALRAYAVARTASVSAAAAAGELVGSLEGPRDLSTASRHMDGFGE